MSVDSIHEMEPATREQETAAPTGQSCSDDKSPTVVVVTFENFTELTTKLVLLPRIEEEGTGAVVASFHADDENQQLDQDQEERDDKGPASSISNEETQQSLVEGNILTAVKLKDDTRNIRDEEFATILSIIREAPIPIVLSFQKDDCEQSPVNKANESMEEEEEKKVDVEDCDIQSFRKETPKAFLHDLSSWTNRVRETSAHLAAEAALSAVQISSKVATAAKEHAKAARRPDDETAPNLSLFVQSSSGAFLPLHLAAAASKSSELVLTNLSLILVRISATKPCPSQGFSFQWYRSTATNDEWIPLEGATNAAFQPSGTEIGYRLRCVVTVNQDGSFQSPNASQEESQTTICETETVVCAALSLFNGTRQTLARGAQFGGLVGRGKAQGRSFRLKVEMTMVCNLTTNVKEPTSAVTIYQVSNGTSEAIHQGCLVGVSAISSHSHPKELALVFPTGLPESASMVSALSEDGLFRLQAPNRLGRESILLAIGIANYVGKPAELEDSTILYDTALQESQPDNHKSQSPVSSTLQPPTTPVSPTPALPRTPVSAPCQKTNLPPMLPSPPLPFKRSASLDFRQQESSKSDEVHLLQEQLHMLQAKLARKDKVVSELQRAVTDTDAKWRKSEQKATKLEAKVQHVQAEKMGLLQSLRKAEKHIDIQKESLQSREKVHEDELLRLGQEKTAQSDRIADLEKMVRTLQNEKAVLSAAVEARESKLGKMADLQASLEEASSQVAKQEDLHKELAEAKKQCKELSTRVEQITASEQDCQGKLQSSQTTIAELGEQLRCEKSRIASHQSELEVQQMKIQKLKAERNSYKQKGDSLAKEMARVCRNGRTLREVEKTLADDAARRQEVDLLREQKRKALEELDHYRNAYEESKMAQRMAGLDCDASKLLERNAELERLLSELTEYVNAKEMQLETIRKVNDALQTEIRDLAKANMSKNDI